MRKEAGEAETICLQINAVTGPCLRRGHTPMLLEGIGWWRKNCTSGLNQSILVAACRLQFLANVLVINPLVPLKKKKYGSKLFINWIWATAVVDNRQLRLVACEQSSSHPRSQMREQGRSTHLARGKGDRFCFWPWVKWKEKKCAKSEGAESKKSS